VTVNSEGRNQEGAGYGRVGEREELHHKASSETEVNHDKASQDGQK
jgi:hypothetical protein